MYQERIEKVLAAMAEMGLDQMLVSNPNSIWYLTGYYVFPYERMLALYLRRDQGHDSVKALPRGQTSEILLRFLVSHRFRALGRHVIDIGLKWIDPRVTFPDQLHHAPQHDLFVTWVINIRQSNRHQRFLRRIKITVRSGEPSVMFQLIQHKDRSGQRDVIQVIHPVNRMVQSTAFIDPCC